MGRNGDGGNENKHVTGEDRKVRILIEWKEPEKPKIHPLTRRQIKFLVWAATGSANRLRPKSITEKKKISEGFSWGYGEMRAHLARFPFRGKGGDESKRDKELTNLLQRLNMVAGKKTVKGSSFAIEHIYNAFYQATKPRLQTMTDKIYFASKRHGWFCYPSICVKQRKWW